MRHATLAVLGLCALAPTVGLAQSADALSIAAGTRARLSGPTKSKGYLTVVSADRDSLRFHVQGDSSLRVLSWQTIDEMDVSRGMHSHIGRDASGGFVGGFLAGAIASAVVGSSLSGTTDNTKSAIKTGVVFGAFLGFLGAALGAQPTETWIPVTLPRSSQ